MPTDGDQSFIFSHKNSTLSRLLPNTWHPLQSHYRSLLPQEHLVF